MALSGSQKALMQARSGLARSGASRSDYYFGFLAATIGGVDRGRYVKRPKIFDLLNEQADTASADLEGFAPTVGQEIVLGSGAINNRVFAGHITRATQLSVRGNAYTKWSIGCTDYTWLLNKFLVTKQYPSQAAHLVAIDIVTNFAPGFTTANIKTSSPTVPQIAFRGERVLDALARLANLAGWKIYPDYFKDIHFFDTETSQAPADLTVTNFSFDNLVWSPSIEQVRTRVYAEGGGGLVTNPVAVGATSIPNDECGWYSATGGLVISGSNILTYTGRSASSGPGNLTGVPASGTGSVLYAIKQGDELNLWVQRDDAAAQAALAALEGGNGIHEYFFQDRRLGLTSLTAQADAELSLGSTVDNQGSYDSRDKFNRSGKSLNITLPARGISAQVLLQSVRREYAAPGHWEFSCTFSRVRRDFYDIVQPSGGSTES